MSVIDAENVEDVVVSNIQPYASDDSDTHEFRPLTEEEKQRFVSFADNRARPFAEEKPDEATNLIEDNEVSASRELLFLPPAEQPLAPLMEFSPLEFRSNQVAPCLHKQDRSVMLQFVLPILVSVIAFFLVLIYPPSRFSLPINIHQAEQPSTSNPLPILASTPEPTADMTALPAPPVVPAVEAPPATQMPAMLEPAVQAPPQMSAKSEPAARARAQASPMKKEGHQQRAAQLAEPGWLTGPAWSRDADSFIRFLYFGRVN